MINDNSVKDSPSKLLEHLPRLRDHDAFLKDVSGGELLSNDVLFRWSQESHSVSGHLQLLYTIASGIQASCLLEVGFGRSSKVLMRVAVEQNGLLYCCDKNDFRYLLSPTELDHARFIVGRSDQLWAQLEKENRLVDFAFLDYFSGYEIPLWFSVYELLCCLKNLRTGGFVCIHDVSDQRYAVRMLPFWAHMFGITERIVFPYSQGLLVIKKGKNQPNMIGIMIYNAIKFLEKHQIKKHSSTSVSSM